MIYYNTFVNFVAAIRLSFEKIFLLPLLNDLLVMVTKYVDVSKSSRYGSKLPHVLIQFK